MQNWAGEQNEAMRGYILLAIRYANNESRAEYGTDIISEDAKRALLKKLYRACDDLTADEAQRYYLNSPDE
jgi:hypothetical protein